MHILSFILYMCYSVCFKEAATARRLYIHSHPKVDNAAKPPAGQGSAGSTHADWRAASVRAHSDGMSSACGRSNKRQRTTLDYAAVVISVAARLVPKSHASTQLLC
jgi:hypothetical protein